MSPFKVKKTLLLTNISFIQNKQIPLSTSHRTIVAPHFAKETAKCLPSPPPPPKIKEYQKM